jgi:hypothetical protein
LVVVLLAGKLVDHYQNSLRAFGVIFAAGSAARLLGLYFLTRMKFPTTVTQRRPQRVSLQTFTAVFGDRKLCASADSSRVCLGFAFIWGRRSNGVYVLRGLHLSVGDLTMLTTLSTLGGLVSLRTWGAVERSVWQQADHGDRAQSFGCWSRRAHGCSAARRITFIFIRIISSPGS